MKIYPLILIVVLSISLNSCQKIINLKLATSPSQTVIVAKMNDQGDTDSVLISKSVNFSDPNVFPQVSGAIVILADNAGNSDTIREASPGNYLSTIKGVDGRTYTLTVKTGGQTYISICTIPQAVDIDTIYIGASTSIGGFGRSNSKDINISFKDPAGVTNYYRVVEYVNGSQTSSRMMSDKLKDGQTLTQSLSTRDVQSGDIVIVSLECVDYGVYEYYETQTHSNIFESASPANPTSNINNSALGYFNAYSVRSKTIIIP